MREAIKEFKSKIGNKAVTTCELGICAGKNTIEILHNLRIIHHYMIDWYRPTYSPEIYRWFESAHSKTVEDKRCTFIINHALKVAELIPDNSIDFLYIDDDHNPEHVYNELKAYWKKVKKGGMIAGHDFDEVNRPERVKLAVDRYTTDNNLKYFSKKNEGEEVGDFWIWKT